MYLKVKHIRKSQGLLFSIPKTHKLKLLESLNIWSKLFRVNIHWVRTDSTCLLTQNKGNIYVLSSMYLFFCICCWVCWFPSSHLRTPNSSFSSLASSFYDTRFSVSPLSSLRSVWQAVLSVTDLFCLCTSLPNLFYETLHLSHFIAAIERGVKSMRKQVERRAKSSVRMVAKCSGVLTKCYLSDCATSILFIWLLFLMSIPALPHLPLPPNLPFKEYTYTIGIFDR